MIVGYKRFVKYNSLWWALNESKVEVYNEITEEDIIGPFCLYCYSELIIPPAANDIDASQNKNWKFSLLCSDCGKENIIKDDIPVIKHFFIQDFVFKHRSNIPKESLDEIPSSVKVRDEDENYFLAAKIGMKDGKRVGVIHFGEKIKKQEKKDYTQVFIDLDDEQVRFDKTNKYPKELLAKMTVEFKDSTHEEIYDTGGRAKKARKTTSPPKRRARTR